MDFGFLKYDCSLPSCLFPLDLLFYFSILPFQLNFVSPFYKPVFTYIYIYKPKPKMPAGRGVLKPAADAVDFWIYNMDAIGKLEKIYHP